MVVFILEKVNPSLRGELSRWLFEIHTGVFVGRVSALVRDQLWDLVSEKVGRGSAILVHSTNTEQGFNARKLGKPSRYLEDIEGLLLVKT